MMETNKAAARAYAAWLRVIQLENACKPICQPCTPDKCGCAAEQAALIEEYRAAVKDANDG